MARKGAVYIMPLADIIDYVRNEDAIYIQTHNYPDHDAVASGMGLRYLLAQFGIVAHIIYVGDIQRNSLKRMIRELDIDIRPASDYELTPSDKIIIVDGCKGNKNVENLVGEEIAVIDHHQVECPEEVRFLDIRPTYGACSTIICDHFHKSNVTIPREVATALMIGINMDTALLTRGVGERDIQAYADLHITADTHLQNSILRNFIQTKDLSFYRYAIDNVEIADNVAFCFFPEGCDQNLLGILADFFLALREVQFVVLCAINNGVVNFSTRNEHDRWNASLIVQDVLAGVGFGGGHSHMAGGIIKDVSLFEAKEMHRKFMQRLAKDVAAS